MIRNKILLKGKVQGVGFRPFVYKLALNLNLQGFIRNDINGVEIQIQGEQKQLDKFYELLLNTLPPLASISNMQKSIIDICYKGQFEIIHSINNKSSHSPLKTVTVNPDTAICFECKKELYKINNKYNNYFGTNCTNCGPRYSIIQTVPYDRINTTLSEFILCKSCKGDYENPLNRRYHAQATICKSCGPQLELTIKNEKLKINNQNIYENISEFINQGYIGAIKSIGGFHLVCSSTNSKVIQKLREYKNRPSKPFALMCSSLEQINSFANINKKEEELLKSKEAPIVILNKKQNLKISDLVAPNITKIACMLPYTALHCLLFNYHKNPIIATSANLNGEPIITTKEDIISKLPFVDFIVNYNRDIANAIDDSVVQVVNNKILTMRLSRGYAPKEIQLPFKLDKKILALGAMQKNTISIAFDNKIITSPYIGDLDSIKSMEFFYKTINTFKRFYDFSPDIIICDKHPNYESTKYAKQLKMKNEKLKIVQVQHHLAHIYSVKAEYNLKGTYLGFAFDGTGYGDDKTLWGGEIFVGDNRKYHFKPIKLLGASKAIKEPKRVALSMLFDKYSFDEILNLDLELIKQFTNNELKVLHQSYIKNLNCPLSSSVGRLFDAIASFANICHNQSYEGEAGLLCEMAYNKNIKDSFEYEIKNNIINIKYDFFDTQIVSKFINTLVKIIVNISIKERLDVILSGGVFQNKILLELLIKELSNKNIKYYYNQETAINDSGISLGQIWKYLN